MAGQLRASADVRRHVDWLLGDVEAGAIHLYLHNGSHDHRRFIETFGERMLSELPTS